MGKKAGTEDKDVLEARKIRAALRRSCLCDAHNMAQLASKEFPESEEIARTYALTLAKIGATQKAREILEDLYGRHAADAETAGLLGRVYKDLWKKTGLREHALQSRDVYLKGFRETKNYYPGINAATMTLAAGDKKKSAAIAKQVIACCGNGKKDYWLLASLGEAYLLVGETEKAALSYRRAVELAGENYGNVNSSYQQLLLISKYLKVPAELFALLKPPGIIAFAGHMIDRPGRAKPRFPESAAKRVKIEIAKALEELDARIGYTSAACGADLLFAEAMRERGAEVNLLMPFNKDDFIKTSVSFAGPQWVKRFHAVLENATTMKYITEEGYFGGNDLFLFSGYIVQGLSILRADSMASSPTFLAVWDRSEMESKQGGTTESLGYWPYPDRVKIVDPTEFIPAGTTGKARAKVKPAAEETHGIPFGIKRELKSIMFADVKGFSKMQEKQTPYFMFEFLQTFARLLKGFSKKPVVLNTWGDAIFAVCDTAKDMADFAFALRDLILKTDWTKKNLPAGMSIRIALHSGPVFVGNDPITDRNNAYGAHINRTARMEPVAVPGSIYASEQFAAKLVVEAKDVYEYEYVGILTLPKGFGVQETYHVRKKNEV